jgi:hypothetical protein
MDDTVGARARFDLVRQGADSSEEKYLTAACMGLRNIESKLSTIKVRARPAD